MCMCVGGWVFGLEKVIGTRCLRFIFMITTESEITPGGVDGDELSHAHAQACAACVTESETVLINRIASEV